MRQVSESLNRDDSGGSPVGNLQTDRANYAKMQAEKLSRLLYDKMMDPHLIRKQNQAPENVRVGPRVGLHDLDKRYRTKLLDHYYEDFVEPDGMAVTPEDSIAEVVDEDTGVPIVDRVTVSQRDFLTLSPSFPYPLPFIHGTNLRQVFTAKYPIVPAPGQKYF